MSESKIGLHKVCISMEIACNRKFINKLVNKIVSLLSKLGINVVKIEHSENISIESPNDAENFIKE
jgi:hypothetical protein